MKKFDIVIIGSGCGAGPSAENFAEAGASVCVLERGTWWGEQIDQTPFPESGWDFLKATRGIGLSIPFVKKYLPVNMKKGLFEYYLFDEYLSLAPCGVGGGSIVIGGFMDKPPADHWDHYPAEITAEVMEEHYHNIDRIEEPTNNPKLTSYEADVKKAIDGIDGISCHKQQLSFWFGDGPDKDEERVNAYGVKQKNHDYRSSDYAGNNRGCKNSLDITSLQTVLKKGGEIRDLCEATGIRTNGNGYLVDYLDIKTGKNETVSASKVMVSAGAVNTTKLLFNSKANKKDGLPNISDQLGNHFGFNGDRVGFKWAPNNKTGHMSGCTLFSYHEIASSKYEFDFHQFATRSAILPWLIPFKAITERFMIFLSLSREEPIGMIRPDGEVMDVYYPAQECHRQADIAQHKVAMEVNALHKPMTEAQKKKKLEKIEKRKSWKGWFAVHQSGGAYIGDTPENGVIDYKGEVFGYPGLYVSDASIFPCAPCSGPHYTIMAHSDRISRLIIDQEN